MIPALAASNMRRLAASMRKNAEEYEKMAASLPHRRARYLKLAETSRKNADWYEDWANSAEERAA